MANITAKHEPEYLWSKSSAPTTSTCEELVTNGGFETGTFDGWSTQTFGSCQWQINDGNFDPPGPSPATDPITGVYDVLTFQVGPGLCRINQTISLPGCIVNATLSWKDRIRNYAGSFSDPNQEARALIILDVGVGPQEIWSTKPGDTLIENGPNSRSYDITTMLQGKPAVDIQFDEQDNLGIFNYYLDDISLLLCSC